MSSPARTDRRLQLEALETRTLLAGDLFGLVADFNAASAALSGVGDYQASFNEVFGNRELVVTGTAEADLVIDLDRLPGFVTNLKISSFNEVTIIGTDRLNKLLLADIDVLNAPQLSITTGVYADNVGLIQLASAGNQLLLTGSATVLDVGSLNNTTIISDLSKLAIISKHESLFVISLNSAQKVYLTSEPEFVSVVGLASTAQIRLGGDFDESPGAEGPSPGEPSPGGAGTGGDDVVVITVPADERIRAFIAELRALLTNPNSDRQQLIFEFIGNLPVDRPALNAASSTVTSELLRLELDRMESFHAQSIAPVLGDLSTDSSFVPTLGQHELGLAGILSTPAAEPAGFEPVLEMLPPAPLPGSIDTGMVVAAIIRNFAETPVATDVLLQEASATDLLPSSEETRTLGEYIRERIAAEFTPGEQTAVLLVDPKPTRPSSSVRETGRVIFA